MEYWDIYDGFGRRTSKIIEKGAPINAGEYQLAIEAWIITPDGRILLQKRSDKCDILPGIWGLTTGRLQAGEASAQGCAREVKEELGLEIAQGAYFAARLFRRSIIFDVFFIKKEVDVGKLTLQEGEVAAAKLVSPEEFVYMIKNGMIYEYPEIYYILKKAGEYIFGGVK